LRPIHVGQVVQAVAHIEVVRTEGCFPDRQRALVEPLCFAVLALG
jgi:hypothetical protein